jgi:hypothetical protein
LLSRHLVTDRIGLNQSSFGVASVVSFGILEFLGCFCFGVCLAVDFPFEIRRRRNKKKLWIRHRQSLSLSLSLSLKHGSFHPQIWQNWGPVWGTLLMFPQVLNQCWPVLDLYEEPLVAILQSKLEQFQFRFQFEKTMEPGIRFQVQFFIKKTRSCGSGSKNQTWVWSSFRVTQTKIS